jgi:cullin-5
MMSNFFQTIHTRLLDAGIELVKKERLGEAIDSGLVVGVRESFVNYDHGKENPLEMYKNHFEARYIESCREFYTPRAAQVGT